MNRQDIESRIGWLNRASLANSLASGTTLGLAAIDVTGLVKEGTTEIAGEVGVLIFSVMSIVSGVMAANLGKERAALEGALAQADLQSEMQNAPMSSETSESL